MKICRSRWLISMVTALVLSSFDSSNLAYANQKKTKRPKLPVPPKGLVISPEDTFEVEIAFGSGKKKVSCNSEKPGLVTQTGEGDYKFVPYNQQLDYLKKVVKNKRTKPKKKRKAKKEIKNLAALIKSTGSECAVPPFLELDPYSGTFGKAEARILFERFAFGVSEQRLAEAVTDGLDVTIAKLTTSVSEANLGVMNLDSIENDIRCDTYIAGHELDDQSECTLGNINDFSLDGVRLGIYTRILLSPNSFFHKLFLFLHDERMAVAHTATNSYTKYSAIRHVDMLRRAAFTGDYKQFMREWNEDLLGHLIWLDGSSNKGSSPNENYAREFWELGTTGPTDLSGKPVYTDRDLAQSALAFSGWTIDDDEAIDNYGEEYRIDVKAYAPDRHASGVFTIFAGTPYEAKVVTGNDVLEATFKHPRTAEHLAEDLWKEYINPWATPTSIKKLAEVIRANDYNLIPVMRVLMKSNALYNPKSRKSLVKHPIELVFGFLKSVPGYPVYRWKTSSEWLEYDGYLEDLGQRPMLPVTVFGWDEKQLAGEAYVLAWRDVVTRMLEMSKKDYTDLNYDFHTQLLGGANLTSTEVILKFADMLNVSLNPNQIQQLDQFMNFHRRKCQNWHTNDVCKSGASHFLEREVFDANPANEDYESGMYKVQALMAILMMLPEYRMK